MTDPCRFVVWPHHPDVLRRPATSGKDACVTHALTWNISGRPNCYRRRWAVFLLLIRERSSWGSRRAPWERSHYGTTDRPSQATSSTMPRAANASGNPSTTIAAPASSASTMA